MLSAFENTVAQFISTDGLFQPTGGILVAVSGGVDSMALMHTLHSLKAAGILDADLTAAHINHQLRGCAADEDEAFVEQQTRVLNLPVLTRRLAVAAFAAEQRLSIETAARQLRMEALTAMAKENGCDYIATAHHKDDNAETIVHRLLRGTGFRGLGGIRPAKKFDNGITFVRPLLCVSRNQILSYLSEAKITWRHDHTNDDQAFTRNFIRHSLLPALQMQSSDSLIELLDRLSRRCRAYSDSLDRQVAQVWPQLVLKKESGCIELDPKTFSISPIPLKTEIIRRALLAIGSGERDLTQQHYERILRFTQVSQPRKKLTVPHGFVIRSASTLIFEKMCRMTGLPPMRFSALPIPGAVDFGPWKIEAQILDAKACDIQKFKAQKTQYVEWFDLEKIVGALTIRPRKSGDSFWPIGLATPKKIGKFLTDAHIESELRKLVYVIDDDEKILWLAPLRASEETKITPDTKKILQITCSPQKPLTP